MISLQSALAVKACSLVCDLTLVALDILCQMSNLPDKSYHAFRVLMAAGKSLLYTYSDYILPLAHMKAKFLCFCFLLTELFLCFSRAINIVVPRVVQLQQ